MASVQQCLCELGLLLFIADIEGLLAEFDVKHTEECITDCVSPRMFVFFAHFLNRFLRSMMSTDPPEIYTQAIIEILL